MTFSDHTKEDIVRIQNNYCGHKGCVSEIHSIHHKLSQTKFNKKKYPLFIHSPFNAIGLCHYHHQELAHEYRVTDSQASIYEEYLNEIKGG